MGLLALLALLSMMSCTKITERDVITANQIPYYDEITTLQVEGYLNRMYIDMVGRKPLDTELEADIAFLRANDLSFESRHTIALRLQTDTTARAGEGSYKTAYYLWFYEFMKDELLESADLVDFNEFIPGLEAAIRQDSIAGDSAALRVSRAQLARITNVLNAEQWYREGLIEVKDMVAYMLDNQLYDKINMQTFNFVNATFDNLFGRFPSGAEFNAAFDIVENNSSRVILGRSASNKAEYIAALVNSREFYEGMISKGYRQLLQRAPSSAEAAKHMQQYYFDHDYPKFQRAILITDEYAQFKPSYR